MNRRVLWICIGLVSLVLVATSLLANRPTADAAMPAWPLALATWAKGHPGIPLGVIGGIALVLASRGGAAVRRRRHQVQGASPDVGFGEVLDQAMRPDGHGPRREQVLGLHRDGRSVGQIARTTRLSQDAVRSVIDAG